jgi:hypothetical protein
MVGLGCTKVLFIDSTSAHMRKGPIGVGLHDIETNAIYWLPAPTLQAPFIHGNNALLTTKFPKEFAMAVTFGCCSKVSHYGSFGLSTMTWFSTWNCGEEKRSFSGLCVEALLEYAII